MRIPAVDTYLEYTAGVDGASLDTFVTPDLTPSGVAYSGQLASLVVAVDDVVTTAYTDNGDGTITLDTPATVGDSVKIWRETPVLESLVTFPVPTKYSPRDNNKAITQLLMCIQELWGGLREMDSKVESNVSTIEDTIAALEASLTAYVNSAVASVFEFTGAATVWSTSVSAGDESLATPYSFTKGLLMVGGSLYNLGDPTHVTLDNSGVSTTIEFNGPMVADMDAILIIL